MMTILQHNTHRFSITWSVTMMTILQHTTHRFSITWSVTMMRVLSPQQATHTHTHQTSGAPREHPQRSGGRPKGTGQQQRTQHVLAQHGASDLQTDSLPSRLRSECVRMYACVNNTCVHVCVCVLCVWMELQRRQPLAFWQNHL